MAKVSAVLRPDRADARGHRALRLRFTDTRRTLYLSLGVRLHPRNWNEKRREVRKGHPHSDQINRLVQARLDAAEAERLRLITARELVTASALRSAVAPAGPEAGPGCLIAYERRYLATLSAQGNVGTVKRNGVVLNKLDEYLGGRPLTFDIVTPDWLRGLEAWLIGTKGNKKSTAAGNIKVLRTVYRRAMKEGVFTPTSDPWLAFTSARASKPGRQRLTLEQIERIEGLDLGPVGISASVDGRTRDAFMLALYAAGMRFGDVARLRVRDVAGRTTEPLPVDARDRIAPATGGLRLVYEMGKTGKRADLRLVPLAERIVRAYLTDSGGGPKPPDAFLFGMLDGYNYDELDPKAQWEARGSQNALANRTLKRIAKAARVDFNLTFHVARHSFADLARQSGWSIYDVSKALAHSSLAQTERYLAGSDAAGQDAKLDGLFSRPASGDGAAGLPKIVTPGRGSE
ncbi:tyrosine-type recombinase/integrase [Rubrivirga sp.]|uniref:tyrosine-type recombinase/integrase n=1 Tax=Rubrivirga sp. TaxID=1885344 RepID=UPI003C73858F